MKTLHRASGIEVYDVLVVGGGIPGLYAARELALHGFEVLLLESSLNPELPNYSTAGIPAETLHEFQLPEQAINATVCHQIIGTRRKEIRKTAVGGETFAYVLDFGKTKRLLSEQCQDVGVTIHFGEKAKKINMRSPALPFTVETQSATSQSTYQATSVIDASGSTGIFATELGLREKVIDRPTLGMEYRIRSQSKHLLKFKNTIAIYFDAELLPYGYGWVFADGDNIFKVGLIEYWTDPARKLPPLEHRLKKFLKFLNVELENPEFEILERHGGLKTISPHFKDVRCGHMYAIGDAIGAINPFLAEGIRQGLISAKYAVDAIVSDSPTSYEKRWNKFKGVRWRMAEVFADLCYKNPDNRFADAVVDIAQKMTSEELRRLVFQYEFELIFKRSPYLSTKAIALQLLF